jgi:hypothetical protein
MKGKTHQILKTGVGCESSNGEPSKKRKGRRGGAAKRGGEAAGDGGG